MNSIIEVFRIFCLAFLSAALFIAFISVGGFGFISSLFGLFLTIVLGANILIALAVIFR